MADERRRKNSKEYHGDVCACSPSAELASPGLSESTRLSLAVAMPGGVKAHGQHNKAHKTGRHQAKGQRHKQREAKGACKDAAAGRLAHLSASAAALPGGVGRARSGGAGGAASKRAGRLLAAKQARDGKRAEVLAAKRENCLAPKARWSPRLHVNSGASLLRRLRAGGCVFPARFEAPLALLPWPEAVKTSC
jgi:hypothetical protein